MSELILDPDSLKKLKMSALDTILERLPADKQEERDVVIAEQCKRSFKRFVQNFWTEAGAQG
jgi:hypothetical protein